MGGHRRGDCVSVQLAAHAQSAGSGQALELPTDSPLRALAPDRPALVVLLRSFGCTFCREAMADVARAKSKITSSGAAIAFVHSESPAEAAPWFAKYGLSDVITISDPELAHYRAFGLGQTPVQALVDPKVWLRGAASAAVHGFGVQTAEMVRRQPGVFVVLGGRITAEFRHLSPSDRPDYLALVGASDAALQ